MQTPNTHETENHVFPSGTEFTVTVHRAPGWLLDPTFVDSYGLIELRNGQFIQSWGPYDDLPEAYAAQERLAAIAALPFQG